MGQGGVGEVLPSKGCVWTGRGQRADRKSSGSHGPEMREVCVSPKRDDNVHTSRDCQAASVDNAQATLCTGNRPQTAQ